MRRPTSGLLACILAALAAAPSAPAADEAAQLGAEVARLHALAEQTPQLGAERKAALAASHAAWRASVAACGADAECATRRDVERIHALRRDYPATRAEDPKSRSAGPFEIRCAGLETPIAITYANSDPGYLYVEWPSDTHVLRRVESGSGAKYEGRDAKGALTIWTKGATALVDLAGRSYRECAVDAKS